MNTIWDLLDNEKLSTLYNDADSQLIDDNWVRSNEFNQVNQTSQIQWSCFSEWFLSCSKCS